MRNGFFSSCPRPVNSFKARSLNLMSEKSQYTRIQLFSVYVLTKGKKSGKIYCIAIYFLMKFKTKWIAFSVMFPSGVKDFVAWSQTEGRRFYLNEIRRTSINFIICGFWLVPYKLNYFSSLCINQTDGLVVCKKTMASCYWGEVILYFSLPRDLLNNCRYIRL